MASPRLFASRAPKTLTVMAIIGYVHGHGGVEEAADERAERAEEGALA